MTLFIKKILNIREGEAFKVFLMFSYIFLAIASLLIVKPVRNSLFISHFGVEKLPYAFILVAICAAIFTHFYSLYANRIRLNVLIFYTCIVSIVSLIVFWILFSLNFTAGWFYYVLYAWVALFGVVITSQFWLLANYVFNAREAKRLFGLIGAGGISGGIFGGYLTKLMAPIVGTHNMFFFCMTFLIICIAIMKKVWQEGARQTYAERVQQEKRIQRKLSSDKPFELFKKSQHLSYLAAIVGIGVIVANLVDYQFSALASEIIKEEDKLTAFFGFWLSNLSLASLLIQLLFTGRSLKNFGVTTSLFFLPFGILIGAFSILIDARLWSAIFIKVCDGSFKQSINKAGLELLALPLPTSLKNQGKAFIDVFVDSLATGIGGVLLILLTRELGLSVQHISFILIGFILVWFYLIRQVKQEYVNSFRLAIEKRSIDLSDQYININEASVFDNIVRIFEGKNDRQILYLLQLIENVKNEKFVPYLRNLITHPSHEIKIQTLHMIGNYENADFLANVKKLVDDPNTDVQVEAIRYIYKNAKNGTEQFEQLINHPLFTLRSAALLAAAYEYPKNKNFRQNFNINLLFENFIDHFSNEEYDEHEIVFMKTVLARVIGVAKVPGLYPFLKNLLHEENLEIVQEATIQAGRTRNEMFIPHLINHLNTHLVRKYARIALAEYENDVIHILDSFLNRNDIEKNIRLAIPKVLALIGTQESVNLLIDNLDKEDLSLRFEIIRALNKLRTNFSYLKFSDTSIQKSIVTERKNFFRIISILNSNVWDDFESIAENQISKSKDLLLKLLKERLDYTIERIFRLLGLKYSPADMFNAYRAITSGNKDLQANAVEFLDNLLDVSLKKIIILIIDYSTTAKIETSKVKYSNSNDILCELLHENDSWLKVCTLYFIAESHAMNDKQLIGQLTADLDPIVRETAQYTLQKL